jgi:hypothetical protein
MPSRTRLAAALAAPALVAAVVAGCSGSDDGSTPPDEQSPSGPTSGPTSGEPTDRPSGDPTSTASSSEFTEGPTQDPNGSPESRAQASQIPADELPGFNDTWTWQIASEGAGPGDSLPSLCMLTSLESIGAHVSYRTDYNNPGTKSARATVFTVVFPDEQTASLAKTVLRSWHAQCEQRLKGELKYERVGITKIRTDSTDVGTGQQWLASFGPVKGHPDDTWFQAEGFVADGDTMTYVVIVNAGQDYNYEVGQEPIDLALDVAGSYLKQSR